MWSPHYVDRLLPQPSNWLPGPASVPRGFTSLLSNMIVCAQQHTEEETEVVIVLRFIFLKCDSLLVLLRRSRSGFWEAALMGWFGSEGGKLSWDWARPFVPLLLCFSACELYLEGVSFGVCLQAL